MKKFYTYIYRDPSRDNEPIYVGKGTGKRAYRHLTKTNMHPFVQRLQLMKRNGIEPDIEIIYAIDEDHAFFMEQCCIEVIGRKDLGKGPLLNLADGGTGGTSGCVYSDETKFKMGSHNRGKKITEATKIKMSQPKSSAHKANISNALKGKIKPKFTCPHCLKNVPKGNLHQWHLDKCKFRIL